MTCDLELVSGLVWIWSEYFLFTPQNHRTVDSIFSWPFCYTCLLKNLIKFLHGLLGLILCSFYYLILQTKGRTINLHFYVCLPSFRFPLASLSLHHQVALIKSQWCEFQMPISSSHVNVFPYSCQDIQHTSYFLIQARFAYLLMSLVVIFVLLLFCRWISMSMLYGMSCIF